VWAASTWTAPASARPAAVLALTGGPSFAVADEAAKVADITGQTGYTLGDEVLAAELAHRQVPDHPGRRAADLPDRGRGPSDQDQEHPRAHRVVGEVVLRDPVLTLTPPAVDHRDVVGGGECPDPAGEPARHPHQERVVQLLVVTVQPHAAPDRDLGPAREAPCERLRGHRRSAAAPQQRRGGASSILGRDAFVSAFTELEIDFLRSQRLARLATASATGQPDVSAVGFGLDGDDIVSGGLDIAKTVRHRHLTENPRASIVIDELASVDPWRPRGVKVRGAAMIEEHSGGLRIRIRPQVIWSWGINREAEKRFASIERREVRGS